MTPTEKLDIKTFYSEENPQSPPINSNKKHKPKIALSFIATNPN
jgi:hypothetical protein